MTRSCTGCAAVLPLRKFPLVKGKPQARCSVCLNSDYAEVARAGVAQADALLAALERTA